MIKKKRFRVGDRIDQVAINANSLASASQGCSDGGNVGVIQPTVIDVVMHRNGMAHALCCQ